MNSINLTLKPIALVESCFKEKFGIPHQSGSAPSSPARLKMLTPYMDPAYFEGIEQFKYLWLVFSFHDLKPHQENQKKVRPPRLGGQKKLGVFATRSPYRPNPLGLSLVEFCSLEKKSNGLFLNIKNHDLLEGTPVFDIKPYHPEADLKADAPLAWLENNHFQEFTIEYSDIILLEDWGDKREQKRQVLEEVLTRDIRSLTAVKKAPCKDYGLKLFDLNIRYRIVGLKHIQVFEIKRVF